MQFFKTPFLFIILLFFRKTFKIKENSFFKNIEIIKQ